ncbi:hypothetical protein OsJ_10920 [Oryza sativa Japonica Group]|uniref:Uncharacterized protein n=1 Tax=Oryza sativa subsp. japonica TaxID=39947 RepID=A3AI56_ORYSJ|nr:hypothetical protein OsJ_10920 [Oryza sativa Japonica Group]
MQTEKKESAGAAGKKPPSFCDRLQRAFHARPAFRPLRRLGVRHGQDDDGGGVEDLVCSLCRMQTEKKESAGAAGKKPPSFCDRLQRAFHARPAFRPLRRLGFRHGQDDDGGGGAPGSTVNMQPATTTTHGGGPTEAGAATGGRPRSGARRAAAGGSETGCQACGRQRSGACRVAVGAGCKAAATVASPWACTCVDDRERTCRREGGGNDDEAATGDSGARAAAGCCCCR